MAMTIANQIFLATFVVTVIMGAVANRTNFCTMGAISDAVNIGDTGRLRAWMLAMAVALTGVLLLEALLGVSVDTALPPYRTASFAWLRYILGGLLFGVGMTLASGCGNKTLVRLGGGNLKSLLVLLVAAVFAYLMTKTDFYAVLFHPWVQATSIDLSKHGIAHQDIGSLIASGLGLGDVATVRLVAGVVTALWLFAWVFSSGDFRSSWSNITGGTVIGLAVIAGWYITGGPMGQEWIDATEWLDEKPIAVATQSFTFINPMGELLAWSADGFNPLLLSFGVVALLGVVTGSFLSALLTGSFRLEWFSSKQDFILHLVGAALMGTGGILAMGCTIGQGVTGTSTLALGSFMALGSMMLGSALTMKFQYYRLVYASEATIGKTLVTALVDLRLLPQGMRRLEAV